MRIFTQRIGIAVLASANSSIAQTPGASGQLAAFNAFIDNSKPPHASTRAQALDEIERIALAENPEIYVASRKVSMAEAHVPTTGKLDDPQFMVRNWQVPQQRSRPFGKGRQCVHANRDQGIRAGRSSQPEEWDTGHSDL